MSEEGEKYRFEYRHFRPTASVAGLPNRTEYKCARYMRGVVPWKPHERGGATLCFVYNDDGESPRAMGLSFCSMKDNFTYALGRKIARGRALAALNGGDQSKTFNGYRLSDASEDCCLWKGVEELHIPAQ